MKTNNKPISNPYNRKKATWRSKTCVLLFKLGHLPTRTCKIHTPKHQSISLCKPSFVVVIYLFFHFWIVAHLLFFVWLLQTHLIYAFAGLSSKYEMKAFDPYNDLQQGNYKKFVGLKQYNPALKTMIAIGGWNEGSKRFSKLVASEDLRYTFIKSAMKFLREHNFDGIDFDWVSFLLEISIFDRSNNFFLSLNRNIRRSVKAAHRKIRKVMQNSYGKFAMRSTMKSLQMDVRDFWFRLLFRPVKIILIKALILASSLSESNFKTIQIKIEF